MILIIASCSVNKKTTTSINALVRLNSTSSNATNTVRPE